MVWNLGGNAEKAVLSLLGGVILPDAWDGKAMIQLTVGEESPMYLISIFEYLKNKLLM